MEALCTIIANGYKDLPTKTVKIGFVRWTKFRTLGEVEDYFSARLALEQAKPQGTANWPEYQKGFD